MTLQIQDMTLGYADIPLLEKLNFTLSPSNLLHITGPNGAGKSTLLRSLATLHIPLEGAIMFNTQDIYEHKTEYLPHLIYCGHQTGLLRQFTVLENLQAMKLFAGLAPDSQPNTFAKALNLFGLAPYLHHRVASLSSGWQQRVALMRTQLIPAKLWVLDEPFTSLDTEFQTCFRECMLTFTEAGGAVVFTSHGEFNDACQTLDLQAYAASRGAYA